MDSLLDRPSGAIRDRQTYLDAVGRSQLLTARQYEKALATLRPDATNAEMVAKHFVDSGLLTSYQANRLLLGKVERFIIGPYRILEPIGHGDTSKIFKARHQTMNRIVALKILPADPTAISEQRQQFLECTRQAVRLLHPHIATTFDADQISNRMYIVREYVDGFDLAAWVEQNGPCSVEQACELARQIALGLAHAHDVGMYHGRLNPAHVLFGQTGSKPVTATSELPRIRLLNFGFREFLKATTASEYTAPEHRAKPEQATLPGDLYSLGAILYFLLFARPVPNGVRIPSHLPTPLAKLLRSLLDKNPDLRPSSAEAVAHRLERFCRVEGRIDFALPQIPNHHETQFSLPQLSETVESPFAGLADETLPNEYSNRMTRVIRDPSRKAWPVYSIAAIGAFALLVLLVAVLKLWIR